MAANIAHLTLAMEIDLYILLGEKGRPVLISGKSKGLQLFKF